MRLNPTQFKHSDVTGNRFEWELGENKVNKTPLPYFIVLASSVTIMEVKAIEFHRIQPVLVEFLGRHLRSHQPFHYWQ